MTELLSSTRPLCLLHMSQYSEPFGPEVEMNLFGLQTLRLQVSPLLSLNKSIHQYTVKMTHFSAEFPANVSWDLKPSTWTQLTIPQATGSGRKLLAPDWGGKGGAGGC